MFDVVKKKVMSFLKELDYFPMNSGWDFDTLMHHLNHDIYGYEYFKEELEVGEKVLSPPQLEEVKGYMKLSVKILMCKEQ